MYSLLCLLRMMTRPVNDEDNEDFIEIELIEVICLTKLNLSYKEVGRLTFKKFMKLYDTYMRINGLKTNNSNGNTVDENGFIDTGAIYF